MRIPIIFLLSMASAVAQNTGTLKTQSSIVSQGAATGSSTSSLKTVKTTSGAARTGPSAAVITIHGLCTDHAHPSENPKSPCSTVLTRKQFETFVSDLNATTTRGVDPSQYRGVAEVYSSLFVNAMAGERAGVDKDPRFEQMLRITRLRALAGMYRSQQFKQALDITNEEIEPFYKKNIDSFEEVDLDRFLLPKNNPANLSDEAFREKSKRLAEELHARAVKGEDIAKLEKEGLEVLGDPRPPMIAVGVRRGQVEEKADKAIFALGPGEVTPVLDERGLWMFFRRTDRKILSMETVKGEILGTLFRDKLDMLDKRLHDAVKVEYDEAYFGPDTEKKPAGDTKAAETASAKQQRATVVSPKDPVLTLHGLCASETPASSTSSCTEVVTREQFDPVLKLALLAATRANPSSPRNVAEEYINTVIYANAAERAGIDKDPRMSDLVDLSRKRALSDMYRLKLDEEAHQVSESDIKTQYTKNLASFDEVQLSHVSILKENPAAHDPDYLQKAKNLAAELRERAARGEDMDKLQREAYEKLGLKNPPAALMQPLRRGSLERQAEREIYALKPGDVTAVKDIPSAYVFYRLENRRTVPFDEAKGEISYFLYRQKLQELTTAAAKNIQVKYDENYFSSLAATSSLATTARAAAPQRPASR